MKKAIAKIALGLSLALSSLNSFGGLEQTKTNLEARVASLTQDSFAIKSETTGAISAPVNLVQSFSLQPLLVGKATMALANSPYFCYSNNQEIIFYTSQGYTSRYQIVAHNSKPCGEGFNQIILIKGNRVFGKFDSCMDIDFSSNPDNTTRYRSKMFIKLENGFLGAILRGILRVPLLGDKLKKSLEEEQDKLVQSTNKVVEDALKKPRETLEKLEGYTNGPTYFTPKELESIREKIEK
ncbi:hypothetical protein FJZ17_00785 [Candidatus Pacearchaeota archaeon]|nr:hypothetical protein [Candidatus Pacearchaeota archaeon]